MLDSDFVTLNVLCGKKSDRHDDNYILNKITNIILIERKILFDVPFYADVSKMFPFVHSF